MVRAPITVITATIPGREQMLAECLRSVYEQTVEVEQHLIMAQSISEGLPQPLHAGLQQNALLAACTTEWVCRLADDDLLLPTYVERILPHLTDDADVVYAFDANQDRPNWDINDWTPQQLTQYLETGNFLDGSAVCIRRTSLHEVGGWPTAWTGGSHRQGGHYTHLGAVCAEDWAMWLLLAQNGNRFRCVPEHLWAYGAGDWARGSNTD